MTIIQSDYAKGRKSAPTSREARGVVVERFEFDVTDDVGTTDVIEFAVLPAYHFIVDAILIPEGDFDAATADIGIMSGAVGDDDPNRTSGDELYDGVALTQLVRATSGLTLDAAGSDRSIGVKFSGAVTAAGQKLTLILFTAQ